MSRRRQVSEEEVALWRAVTRTVSPLKRHRKAASAAPKHAEPKPGPPARPASPLAVTATLNPAPKAKPREPALAPLDRRSKQKLARGRQAIDARIDLHGRTQGEAHAVLLRFLQRAQANGAKTVLVITGKGRNPANERGVLKRQVPMWLALPEFRGLVVGFAEAAVGHGGAGALYVRVRRSK
ncbi:MAG: DNA mismatch repair protein MutS [Rhizobiales bacterium]|nr:DNA mismatch repair protein MutS [Hyphomicrobiales bacterium]